MLWEDDKIYLASKKGYSIVDKATGTMLASYALEERRRGNEPPLMAVARGKCLVLTNQMRVA